MLLVYIKNKTCNFHKPFKMVTNCQSCNISLDGKASWKQLINSIYTYFSILSFECIFIDFTGLVSTLAKAGNTPDLYYKWTAGLTRDATNFSLTPKRHKFCLSKSRGNSSWSKVYKHSSYSKPTEASNHHKTRKIFLLSNRHIYSHTEKYQYI